MSSKITIIRHAPTEYNKQNIFMGTLDIPINSFDENKIIEVQKLLSEENFTSIFSSPLKRAVQTAKKICGDNSNIILDNRLIERSLGIWQGLNKNTVREIFPSAFFGEFMDFYYTPEKAEPFQAMVLRIASFICEYCQPNSNILVFTHNGVFRVLKSLLTKEPLKYTFRNKEPFLCPQSFVIDDELYQTIRTNPLYTVDKYIKL